MKVVWLCALLLAGCLAQPKVPSFYETQLERCRQIREKIELHCIAEFEAAMATTAPVRKKYWEWCDAERSMQRALKGMCGFE